MRYLLLVFGFVLLAYFIATVTTFAEDTREEIKPKPVSTAPCTADEMIEAWTFDYQNV